MTDTNAAAFDAAKLVFTGAVTEAAGLSAAEFQQQLLRFLNQNFVPDTFRVLEQKAFGKEGLGSVNLAFGPTWKHLAWDYVDRKLAQDYSQDFYERKGDLRAAISSLKARELYGPARVGTGVEGSGLRSDVFIDRAGRPQYRRGSGRSGFAAYKDAFENFVISLGIDVFPGARNKTADALIRQASSGYDTLKWSILEHGKRHQPARPLIVPFLKWYSTVNLRAKIKARFNVDIPV